MHQRNKEKGICLNPKVTNLQANVEECQANVGKELDELREVVKKQKVGNGGNSFKFETC